MSAVIEVQLTNFPYPSIDHSSRSNDISAFGGRLILKPILNEAVQTTVRGKFRRALKTISAVAYIDEALISDISPNLAESLTLPDLSGYLCDLLSLSSRRAVNFKPHRSWHLPGTPVARGGFASRGPLCTNIEVGNLIDRGLPKLSNPQSDKDERLLIALRWFMLGYSIAAWEVKMIWWWSVLEMLCEAYWEEQKLNKLIPLKSGKGTNKVDEKIEPYLIQIGIPEWRCADIANCVNLHDIYTVRCHIMHGDPRLTSDSIRLFSSYAEKRRSELMDVGHAKHNLPNPQHFGACMHEAVHLLSRLLEKVFLNQFECQDSWYYIQSPYHTSSAH